MKRNFSILVCILTISMSPIFADQQSTDEISESEVDEIELCSSVDGIENSADQPTHSIIGSFSNSIKELVSTIMGYLHSLVGRSNTANISEDEIYSLLCHRNNEQQIDPRREKILAEVAKIVGGILTIANDPHNARDVGNSVGNMMQGIINITIDAVKNKEDKKILRAQFDKIGDEINSEISREINSKLANLSRTNI